MNKQRSALSSNTHVLKVRREQAVRSFNHQQITPPPPMRNTKVQPRKQSAGNSIKAQRRACELHTCVDLNARSAALRNTHKAVLRQAVSVIPKCTQA